MAKIPSMLNYTRSIIPSEGTFWAVKGDKKVAVLVAEKTVLGTIANYGGVDRTAKADAEKESAKVATPGANNIQRIHACSLPSDCDRLALEFSLKFMNNGLEPDTCNEVEFADQLKAFAAGYKAQGGFQLLAERYVANLLNGRFLWRNRYGTDRTLTLNAPNVKGLEKQSFEINDSTTASVLPEQKQAAQPWIDAVAQALSGETDPFLLEVSAEVTIGMGQEVYPSQEFVDAEKKGLGKIGKVLFSLPCKGGETAGMHSQKIGNALRTIDTWYPKAEAERPLAVEPYTVDKRRAQALRLPGIEKSDFYSHLAKVEDLTGKLEGASGLPGDAHYFMAVLIRGGVFSGDKKSK